MQASQVAFGRRPYPVPHYVQTAWESGHYLQFGTEHLTHKPLTKTKGD